MTFIKIDFASSHKGLAKNVTKKSIGQFPSPQELSFIDNAYEKDEWWLLTAS